MYQIAFYVPASHLEIVKNAMFAKQAGRIGNYDCCAWQTKGEGQFRPLSGSRPFLGEKNKITYAEEYFVHMVCDDIYIHDVIKAMKSVHPYEEPAYAVWPITYLENL